MQNSWAFYIGRGRVDLIVADNEALPKQLPNGHIFLKAVCVILKRKSTQPMTESSLEIYTKTNSSITLPISKRVHSSGSRVRDMRYTYNTTNDGSMA
ncbi:uncharacterized protein H6S33_012355 [Morchella sextelata]|uniref:uncharacterized protein n=1 Tax=Morchella sextelata TaxID=1174677 RepID=UPI001D041027|nr:uncharacterized protein H6S33_012355 [Morchella sextelata]KAH0609809.1 hypothetical protein H6S33_012355 [Morchella sextelata]